MRDKSEPSRTLQLIPWIPTILGVIALLAVMMIAAIRLTPWSSRQGPLLPVPLTAPPAQVAGQDPSSPPVLVTATSAAPSPPPTTTAARTGREPTANRPTTAATPTSPAAQPVVGHYRVLQSFRNTFIGEVLIVDNSGEARDWTVVLTFPDDVGRLRRSWLESLPQPTLARSGQTYTWRSTVPLAAHSSGALRFQFDRVGSREAPSRCLTNGSACR